MFPETTKTNQAFTDTLAYHVLLRRAGYSNCKERREGITDDALSHLMPTLIRQER